jgi:PBSX family phage terminase large subunit
MPRRKRHKPQEAKQRRFVALYPQQVEFFSSKAWITGFCSGIAAGKTRTAATRVILSARDGETHLALSPSYVMLRKSSWPMVQQVAKELDVWKKGVLSPFPVATIKTQDGGEAEIFFGSCENPEAIRGMNASSVWIDEASLCPEMAFKVAVGRLRGIRGERGPVLLSFTPRGREHWTFDVFYEEYIEPVAGPNEAEAIGVIQVGGRYYKPKPNTKLVRATSRDNPFISEEFYDSLVSLYSTSFAAQELEGEFISSLGTMFRREWFVTHMVETPPRKARRVRYWDLAGSEDTGCYTGGVMLAMDQDGIVYIENVVRGQWSSLTRNTIIKETSKMDALRYGNEVHQVVEQEPGSGGKEQAQQMIRMLAGVPVFRDLPSRGRKLRTEAGQKLPGAAKIIRAQPFAAQCEAGNVRLVRGEWNEDYLAEITAFPEMSICDQVDASSAAYNYLAKSKVPMPDDILTVGGASGSTARYGIRNPVDIPTFIGRN